MRKVGQLDPKFSENRRARATMMLARLEIGQALESETMMRSAQFAAR